MSDKIDSITFCPIVYPDEKQFQNFYKYMQFLQAQYKNEYGMVKIVPPKGWTPRGQNYESLKQQLKVRKPIQQHAKMVKNDYYEIRNIINQTMDLKRFQKTVGDRSSVNETSPQKIQKMFWKTIKYTPPIYGADLHGSFMSDKAKSWNLGKLDSLLTDAAPILIKGVTYPYVYVGTWKSTFCWHKEDLDLASINYLHQGSAKYWYCIQADHQNILEEDAHQSFPDNYASCKNFMRHKTTLINPYTLKEKNPNLKISKAHQGPNEFVVAFSGAYHCGFNSGKNIAQAVNYATLDWLKKLKAVTFCTCTTRSVRPFYKYLIDNLESQQSRFRDELDLKILKNWVIQNGYYIQQAAEQQNSPSELATTDKPVDKSKTKQKKLQKQKPIRKKTKRVQNKNKKLSKKRQNQAKRFKF